MSSIRIDSGWITAGLCITLLTGCIPAVPQDLLSELDMIDQDLIALGAPYAAPEEYADFARQWAALKVQADVSAELIRWPWESNDFEEQLRQLHAQGDDTVALVTQKQDDQRRTAKATLDRLEERFRAMNAHIDSLGGHLVLGEQPTHTDLLIRQTRTYFEQDHYTRAIHAAAEANQALQRQEAALTQALKRYADPQEIARWQAHVQYTVDWSRIHRSPAILVSKADRELRLYKNGRNVLSYPIRLGYNGIKNKEFQGDGATPEGRYQVRAMRGKGETQFYRALLLDYPNAEDRRRFQRAIQTGQIAPTKTIGGLIEIHGTENDVMAQTLGCIMLDNPHMSELFSHVTTGTPVTIVGATSEQNTIALALEDLSHYHEPLTH
ncbi:MAG: L,D-transpeptidase [Nitrospira sp.]|nr:L,D-transpeptidase [Nitrospira sp.]